MCLKNIKTYLKIQRLHRKRSAFRHFVVIAKKQVKNQVSLVYFRNNIYVAFDGKPLKKCESIEEAKTEVVNFQKNLMEYLIDEYYAK